MATKKSTGNFINNSTVNTIDEQQKKLAEQIIKKEKEIMNKTITTNTNGTDNADERTIQKPEYANKTTEAPAPRFIPKLGEYINDNGYYEYVGPIYEFQYRGGKFITKILDKTLNKYQVNYTDKAHATHIRLFWVKGNYPRYKDFDLADPKSLLKAIKILAPYDGIWLTAAEYETIIPSLKKISELSSHLHLKTMYLGFFKYTNEETKQTGITFSVLKPNVLTQQIISNDDFDI
jgi:hypothetical protein